MSLIYNHLSGLVPCQMPLERNIALILKKTSCLYGTFSFESLHLSCYIDLQQVPYENRKALVFVSLKYQEIKASRLFTTICCRSRLDLFGIQRVHAIFWPCVKCNYASPTSMTRLIYLTPRETARPKVRIGTFDLIIYCTQDIEYGSLPPFRLSQ